MDRIKNINPLIIKDFPVVSSKSVTFSPLLVTRGYKVKVLFFYGTHDFNCVRVLPGLITIAHPINQYLGIIICVPMLYLLYKTRGANT
jgi:hypothetical protein